VCVYSSFTFLLEFRILSAMTASKPDKYNAFSKATSSANDMEDDSRVKRRAPGTLDAESWKNPSMVVLAGLAENTGLKEISFKTDSSGETNATLATAWTIMLQRNTSITKLDLRQCDSETTFDCELYYGLRRHYGNNYIDRHPPFKYSIRKS
jgi:hypothetical protein